MSKVLHLTDEQYASLKFVLELAELRSDQWEQLHHHGCVDLDEFDGIEDEEAERMAKITRAAVENTYAAIEAPEVRLTNLISEGETFTQAEAACCIWEHALESHDFFDWLKQGDGAAYARAQAINIAHLVEIAYQTGNGDDHLLDKWSFDWEACPMVADEFMKMVAAPCHVTSDTAIDVGKRLVALLEEEHS